MYFEVYPDIVFLINYIIDFALLYLLKKINRKDSTKARMFLAPTVGALTTTIVSVFPWINLLVRILFFNVGASALMILIAFKKLKVVDLLKQVVVLNLITYFAGGFMNSIYYYTNIRQNIMKIGSGITLSNISIKYVMLIFLIIVPITLLFLWFMRMIKNNTPLTYDVDLVLDGQTVNTRGMLDTGNCLYDPVYKKPVMVIDSELVNKLIPQKFRKDIEAAKVYINGNACDTSKWEMDADNMLRLRFIPYSSIGKTGMMLGINIDKVLIHTGKETICNEKVTVAISDNQLSTKDKYHVIIHKDLL